MMIIITMVLADYDNVIMGRGRRPPGNNNNNDS